MKEVTLATLAQALTEVDVWVEAYPAETVLALWEARAWEMLNYPSWEALCESRGWRNRVALPKSERQEVVGTLRQSGMSTRAIASAVGANHSTVVRDLQATGADAPDEITSKANRKVAQKMADQCLATHGVAIDIAVLERDLA